MQQPNALAFRCLLRPNLVTSPFDLIKGGRPCSLDGYGKTKF